VVGTLSCRAAAMNFLAQREHSQYELNQKLERKGFSAQERTDALLSLQNQRLQSDERFSEGYARYRATRGYGPLRIKQELQQRGVKEELIQQAIQQFSNQEWRAIARRVYHKRFAKEAGDIDFKQRAAQTRFLLYRGFSGEMVREVMHLKEYNP